MELSSNFPKPSLSGPLPTTTSFIKAPPKEAVKTPVPASSAPTEQAQIDWSAPAWDAQPQPSVELKPDVSVKTPQFSPYQAPAGTSGPLTMDFDSPKQTVAESSNPVATNLLSGILANVLEAGVQSAKDLLSSLGVKANQRTGDSFDRSLQGEARRAQNTEWRAGQVAGLLNHGRSDWAEEVVRGQYDKLAGQNLTTKLTEIKTGDREFGDRFNTANWKVTESISDRAPHVHSGREVAFRVLSDKGEVEELRGVVTGTEHFSALFKLQGQDREFNTNNIREMAVRPVGVDTKEPGPARADYQTPGLGARPGKSKLDATPVGQLPDDFLYTLSKLPPNVTKDLLEKYGVEPNQATGERFKPNLDGVEQKKQLENWKLGQVAEFLSQGRDDLLPAVFNGHYDKQAGQPLLSKIQSEEKASDAFNAGFDRKGWATKKNGADLKPLKMDGKMVHFRAEGEDGEMHEFSGILRANRDHNRTAMFTIDGHKGEFNNNYIEDMAISPAPTAKKSWLDKLIEN